MLGISSVDLERATLIKEDRRWEKVLGNDPRQDFKSRQGRDGIYLRIFPISVVLCQ
jgi:hypothetical protein